MAARTELSGPACTGFVMEPNPKNAGLKMGYHSDSQRIGRKVTTASKDWHTTRRKRSNGDTDEREGEEGPATGPTLETIRPPSIKKHFYQKFICTNFLILQFAKRKNLKINTCQINFQVNFLFDT